MIEKAVTKALVIEVRPEYEDFDRAGASCKVAASILFLSARGGSSSLALTSFHRPVTKSLFSLSM